MSASKPPHLRSPTPTLPGAWPNISQQLFDDFALSMTDVSRTSSRYTVADDQPAGPTFLAGLDDPRNKSTASGFKHTVDVERPDSNLPTLGPTGHDFLSPLSTASDLAVVPLSATASTFGTSSRPSSPLTPLDNDTFHHSQSFEGPSFATIRSPTEEDSDALMTMVHAIKLPAPRGLAGTLSSDASSIPSPNFEYMSPRPLPELPSLTSSFSTAASSTLFASTANLRQHVLSPLNVPALYPPASDVDPNIAFSEQSVESGLVLPSASSTEMNSPDTFATTNSSNAGSGSPFALLNLSEPHSPDSAHFSPVQDLISFASPSSSQFQLSLPRTSSHVSADSVITFLQLPGSPPLQDSESAMAINGHVRCQRMSEEPDPQQSQPDVEEPYEQAEVDIRPPKRSFLGKVKRFGGRLRVLFKNGGQANQESHSVASTLVSPHATTPVVSVFLPPTGSPSPISRRVRRSQTPPPAVVPHPTSPSRRPRTPGSRARIQSRRFSLPTLFTSRQMSSASPLLPMRSPSPLVIVNPDADLDSDIEDNDDDSGRPARMIADWTAGRPGGSRFQDDEVVRGLGIGLPPVRRMSGVLD